MGIIAKDDIRGYENVDAGFAGEELIVCPECITAEQEEKVKEDDIITTQDIEKDDERIFFCGVCKKQL